MTPFFHKIRLQYAAALLLSFMPAHEVSADMTALFIGDSITDGGWGRSGGMPKSSAERNKTDQNHALGHSYVMLASARMMADDPALKCNWLNRGISGNTVKDLQKRWSDDMLSENPDVLTVMVGINDIFDFYRENDKGDFDVESWGADLREILTEAKTANPSVKIVLMSPFVAKGRSVKPEKFQRIRTATDRSAAKVKTIAEEIGAEYIDTNALFNSLTDGNPDSERWLWDGVHPTPAGHQMIADLWVKLAKDKDYIH